VGGNKVDKKVPEVQAWNPKGKKGTPRSKPTVVFSEKMDPDTLRDPQTLRSATFILKKETKKVAVRKVEYTESGTTCKAALYPRKKLMSGATYTATVTTAATDEAGNGLAEPTSRKFRVK
jgi:hypothetical protein